ncbi:MAG: HDOD domain-containing protein [Gammaproteobacteria bacterium]|nr:HDOD domain-containing protein [Gammaproteobacteria bacterium]
MPPRNDTDIGAALRQLDPLAGLGDPEIDALARDVQLLQATAGTCLLERGCEDSRQLFLLDGAVELVADDGATHVVRDRDAAARGPVSRLRPSRYRVTARSDVSYLLIDLATLEASNRGNGVIVEETFAISEPNEFLDDSASHPLIYDVFNDINLGRVVIPSGAKIAVRVGRALQHHEDDLQRFVDSLMACPALTLKTLRAARAGSRKTRCTRSAREAVVALGTAQTYALAVNCVLRETLRTDAEAVERRMQTWWERTVRIAAICRVLARGSERFDPEFAALIGLLHSIAEPVMLGYADRHPDLADAAALDNVLRGNRAEIGRILLAMWDMPRELIEAAAHSNHWGYDHNGEADYTDILLVAQWHATIGDNTRPRNPAFEDIPAFRHLGLDAPSPDASLNIVEAATSAVERINGLLAD